MRKTVLVVLLFSLVISTLAASTEPVKADGNIPPRSTVLYYYDGQATTGSWEGVEVVTTDQCTVGQVSPGPYPYQFSLSDSLHIYLEIRHFLWAYSTDCTNHLTIWIDGGSVLEAYSPRTTWPNEWYPGDDGLTLVDLGMISAGTHFMAMSCNISGYYMVDWWEILSVASPGVHNVAFYESGLAQGTEWSVTFNNQTQSSISNSMTFCASDGVYSFSTTPPSGYSASLSSGSITVSGTDVTETVTFYQLPFTLTSVYCSPNPVSVGSPATCTAIVLGSNPAGTVTWSTSSNTGSFSQNVCILSSGSCSTTYTGSSPGPVTITAGYSGDSNNAPSSNSTTLTVARVLIPEDVNGDGKVDMRDLALVAKAFGLHPGNPGWNGAWDVNNDGRIDLRDIGIIAGNFGQHYP